MEYFIFNFDRIKFIFDHYLSDWKYDNLITDDVWNVFIQKKIVGNENVKTFLDHVIGMLSRLFDVNFSWTKKLLKLIWYCDVLPDILEADYWVPSETVIQIKKILNQSLEE
jgi:hypothetical protein